MKIFLTVTIAAALAVPAAAQTKAPAKPKAAPAAKSAPAQTDADKAVQELRALNEKERAELKVIDDAAQPVTAGYQEKMKALQAQMKTLSDTYRTAMDSSVDKMYAVRAKYAPQKYALLNRINPGAGNRLQAFDKATLELEAGWKKDIKAINEAETAEMNRGGLTDTAAAKYQAQRKALGEAYNAKRKELQAAIFAQPAPQAPAAQPKK